MRRYVALAAILLILSLLYYMDNKVDEAVEDASTSTVQVFTATTTDLLKNRHPHQ